MDKFQAAFEILYFLSAVDGHVDDREVQVVCDFLSVNYGKIDFKPKQVIDIIQSMTSQGMLEELQHAALVFKGASSAQDRNALLDFAFKLIAADGKIAEAEKDLFIVLGNTWNVDIPKFLANMR